MGVVAVPCLGIDLCVAADVSEGVLYQAEAHVGERSCLISKSGIARVLRDGEGVGG